MKRNVSRRVTSLIAVAMLFYVGFVTPGQAQETQLDMPSRPGFIDNGDGTITDRKTGLMWCAGDGGRSMSLSQGKEYASSLQVAGYSDWRLPTRDELAGLYENLGPESGGKNDRRVKPFHWNGYRYLADGSVLIWGNAFDFERGSKITKTAPDSRFDYVRAVRAPGTPDTQVPDIAQAATPSQSPEKERTGTFLWGFVRGVFLPVIVVKIGISSLVYPQEGRDAFSLIWDSFWTDRSDAHRAGVVIGAVVFWFVLGPLMARNIFG